LEKRTSGAKALIRFSSYGTAKPVPLRAKKAAQPCTALINLRSYGTAKALP
jgi:hypothetical protein